MILVNDRYITIPDNDVFITSEKIVLFKVNSTDETRTYLLFVKRSDNIVVAVELTKQIYRDHTTLEWRVLPEHLKNSGIISISLKVICSDNQAWTTREDYLVVLEDEETNESVNVDYQRGYKDGYEKGLFDGKVGDYDLGYTEGKQDGITEGYNNGYEQGKTDGYKDGYNEGYSQGYSEGYEKGKAEGGFDYTKYAKSLTFDNSFSEVTEDVYLDLSKLTTLLSCLRCSVNCEKVTVKVSDLCKSFNWAFAGNTVNNQEALKIIEILGDTSGVTNFEAAFRNRRNLESILGEIDFSGVTQSRFVGSMWINNEKMKEIYPKAGTIKVSISFYAFANPPDECINAIVNGLADLTGQESQTVTLHANVKAKLTDEQIATITGKNWTLA